MVRVKRAVGRWVWVLDPQLEPETLGPEGPARKRRGFSHRPLVVGDGFGESVKLFVDISAGCEIAIVVVLIS